MFINKYYNNIVRRDMLLKFNYVNEYDIPKISNIDIRLHTNNISLKKDIRLISTLFFLEFLTGVKGKITSYKKLRHRTGLMTLFSSQVRLRTVSLMSFLQLMKFYIFPKLVQSSLDYSVTKGLKRKAIINIRHLNVFYFIPDYFFKWQNSLNIDIIVDTTDTLQMKFLLRSFAVNL